MNLYNHTKGRKATANETAKHILMDAMYTAISLIHERMECEGMSEEQIQEVERHALKHANSIHFRLSNGDNINWK